MFRFLIFVVYVIGVIRMTNGSCSTLLNCVKQDNPNFGSNMTVLDYELNNADSFEKGWKNLCRYGHSLKDCISPNHLKCPQVYSFISPYLTKEQIDLASNRFCFQIFYDVNKDVFPYLEECMKDLNVLSKILPDCLHDTFCRNLKCTRDAIGKTCGQEVATFMQISVAVCGGSKATISLVFCGLIIISWLFTKM